MTNFGSDPPRYDRMKDRRKLNRSALPPAPLEFASPLAVEGADVGGAVLLAELPKEYGLAVWRTHRLVLSLAKGAAEASSLSKKGLAEWEQYVLTQSGHWHVEVWSALAVIASTVRNPATADREWIAFACVALADWSLSQGARGAALCLAEAAALAAPANPRYAYVAGRMHRERGNYREAERWLDRSRRVAVWHSDGEAIAIALNSLGNLKQQTGRYREAEELLTSALRAAKRAGVRERFPFIYHDLLVVAVYTGDLAKAREYAREAFNGYPPGHPNIPRLAHDIAYLWTQHGQFRRALQVFQSLLPHFTHPEPRLHVLGYAARAAGALGDSAVFDEYWAEAWDIIRTGVSDQLRAAAALELGLGALNLSRWDEAWHALDVAAESAAAGGDNETIVKASAAVDHLRRREIADRTPPPRDARSNRADDDLASKLAAVLSDTPSAPDVSGREPDPFLAKV